MRYKFSLILFLTVVAFFANGCVKNPDSGEYEPDFPKIAEVTQITARNLTYTTLVWFQSNHPEHVVEVYNDFATVITIVQAYNDGLITVGRLAQNAVDIFKRVQARVDSIGDNFLVNFAVSTISALTATLDIAIASAPNDAVLILTGLALGSQGGLEDFNAWLAASTAPPGVTP